MKKRSKKSKIWWIMVLAALILAIYLNRSYAYFYNFIDEHKIMPLGGSSTFNFPTQDSKSRSQIKYIALGDSLTHGVGVEEDNQTFPYLVAKSLSKSAGVELVNLGIPGAMTEDVIRLELPKLDELKPNFITLLIGTNDAQSLETENAFKQNYQLILNKITEDPQTKVVVLNIPSLSHNLLFPYKYLVDLRIRRFNSIIETQVKEKKESFPNLIFINLYDQTKQQFMGDITLYSPDIFHPSAKGYKLWSEIVTDDSNF